MMKRFALLLSILVCAADAFARCEPKNVLRVVFSFDDPSLPADHAMRAPRTLYRQGRLYGRMEEQRNRATGIHLLVVVNGADLWMVDRAAKRGEHALDPGPELSFRAPIHGEIDSELWNNFEFGCEVPFMLGVGAKPATEGEELVYTHSAEGLTARLRATKSGIPKRIDFEARDGSKFAVVYHEFGEVRDPPADLFAKPAGITFTEKP